MSSPRRRRPPPTTRSESPPIRRPRHSWTWSGRCALPRRGSNITPPLCNPVFGGAVRGPHSAPGESDGLSAVFALQNTGSMRCLFVSFAVLACGCSGTRNRFTDQMRRPAADHLMPPPTPFASSGFHVGPRSRRSAGNHSPGQDCQGGCHNHGFTLSGTLFAAGTTPVVAHRSGVDANARRSTWSASATNFTSKTVAFLNLTASFPPFTGWPARSPRAAAVATSRAATPPARRARSTFPNR